MKTAVLVYCLLAAVAFAQSSDSLYKEERSLIAKLEKFPDQTLTPLPSDTALPFTEYFRYEDRLYKKTFAEGPDGRAWITEFLCTNEHLDTWQEKEPKSDDLKKVQAYVAAERPKARVEIQNKRNLLLLKINSLQKRQQIENQKEIARQSTTTEILDYKGRIVERSVTRPSQ